MKRLGVFRKSKEINSRNSLRYSECTRMQKFYPDLIFDGKDLCSIKDNVCWKARSGPYGNGAAPKGKYIVENFRIRHEKAYKIGSVGFSVNIEPQFETNRTDLRIHPDGNSPGTLGCIGIYDEDLEGAMRYLQRKLDIHGALTLEVR